MCLWFLEYEESFLEESIESISDGRGDEDGSYDSETSTGQTQVH